MAESLREDKSSRPRGSIVLVCNVSIKNFGRAVERSVRIRAEGIRGIYRISRPTLGVLINLDNKHKADKNQEMQGKDCDM